MSFYIISVTTLYVVFSLLTNFPSSASDANGTESPNTTEIPDNTTEIPDNTTEITHITTGSTESTEIPSTQTILRLNCTYNGTTWRYNYFNNTNPECKMYFCNNGSMEVESCRNGPPQQYGSCIYVRRRGRFPRCCYYERAC
uniref:8.9 kDa family member n=1 Tax=Rhipicephalus zambeziensis TaxID=60191 RepID=A0A224YAC1_9ACAR